MRDTTHNGLDAQTANWDDSPFSHRWGGEGCGKLRQAKSVPTEHAAACLNNTTCELVGSIKACPNNQQLFCWIAKTEPSAGTRDAAMAHRGDASGRAHTHTLRSAEQDENRRSTPGIRRRARPRRLRTRRAARALDRGRPADAISWRSGLLQVTSSHADRKVDTKGPAGGDVARSCSAL